MTHEEWLAATIGVDSQRAAAIKVGVPQSTISRQLARRKLDAELVVSLARAYGVPAGQALIDTGYLEPADLRGVGVQQALGRATNHQLLEEIMRRTDPDAVRIFDGPADADVITPRFGAKDEDDDQPLPMAARRLDAPSPGEALYDHLDGLGEESQIPPGED
ncbi:helix-turn-helix transcriptional regulator [Gordonia sp. PDNC005]|uniref:helix-turn-helix domain-containing protein n=1 Tax=Gordonia sp. PDNC005 TaxID=2811424 RepID=UPI001965C78D|nr:helix-turn-helix transcriptional regulator [Gordonia sp. PDNC005]QRY62698.1 helix-turn-helix transcriptional regulator [Gordonia sp. PDNC005]